MRRRTGSGAALGLLLLAVLLPRPAPPADARLLAALGRSAGGLGVLVSDMLFLRADQLRRTGRPEEVPALYRAVLDLEPDNVPAADFLVALQAYDLLGMARDADDQRGWWREAWQGLAAARARHPADATLLTREADLLLDVPARHPEVAPEAAAAVPDPTRTGLERLLEAARLTPVLPHRGRYHLLVLSELLPVVASLRLATREADPILELGDELLGMRGDVLGEMTRLARAPDGSTLSAPRRRVLEAALAAVRARASGDPAAAGAALEAYRALAPDSPALPLLEASPAGP